jgi:tRNA(Glu) U13 pseudouridine synthase TruD
MFNSNQSIEEKEKRKQVHDFFKVHFNQKLDTKTVSENRISIVPKSGRAGKVGANTSEFSLIDNRKNQRWASLPEPHTRFVLYKEGRDTLEALSILGRCVG